MGVVEVDVHVEAQVDGSHFADVADRPEDTERTEGGDEADDATEAEGRLA